MKTLPFYLSFLIPASVFFGLYFGGVYFILTPVLIFVLHPIFDSVLPSSDKVYEKEHWKFSFPLFLHFFVQLGLILYSLYFIRTGHLRFLQWFFMALIVGMSTGAIGITIAHELIHRRVRWERAFGVGFLGMVSYMHYRIEHVFGHHQNVATPEDPATAKLGESLYVFWPKSIFGTYFSAMRIESKNRKGLSNRMVHYFFMQVAFYLLVFFYSGLNGLGFFLTQSLVAILFLETINYIEHYGLSRKKNENGKYEPVTRMHSWDSDRRLTNWMLFNLGRHAHHHARASDEYETLTVTKGVRTFRFGYSTMVLLAFVPPLWKRVMGQALEKSIAQ